MLMAKAKGLLLLPVFLSLITSCQSVKIDAHKRQVVVVRDSRTNELLDSVQLTLADSSHNFTLPLGTTDALGYAEWNWEDQQSRLPQDFDRRHYYLHYERKFSEPNAPFIRRDSIRLNNYLGFTDLYLDSLGDRKKVHTATNLRPVADMHYHVSMRTHNRFGHKLYADPAPDAYRPNTVNLFKSHPHLRVLHNGRWKRPYLGKIKMDKVATSKKWARRRDKLETLLCTEWVRPKSKYAVNHLKQYTQATHPHLVEGGVYLAYNAISPFEHNASNTWKKRLANNVFVTKANKHWLRRIGWKTKKLTHWQNFLNEYEMITGQQGFYQHAGWRFFQDSTDLYQDHPTIINVLEGSHVFQDRLFPHVVHYNIGNRTQEEDRGLFNTLLKEAAFNAGSPDRLVYEKKLDSIRIQFPQLEEPALVVLKKLQEPQLKTVTKNEWEDLGLPIQQEMNIFLDTLLEQELTTNIRELKQLQKAPIAMVTIAHLTYNGMVGHAPGLNGGGFFTKLFARKNYSIRVSDDPTYEKQWASAFFTIPGVNRFGRAVIDSLVATENGHRILIDLKHSDFITRQYFYDEVMIDPGRKDTIPPICSHCGVTGLPNAYFSPLTDEFSLLESSSVHTLYPFGINLYDEEITTICQNGGIIGIPLFQQVLGGNINKRMQRDYRIKKDGAMQVGKNSRIRRKKETRRLFRYYQEKRDPDVRRALNYTQQEMGITHEKRQFKRTVEDYISAEPFIQNLFYILDHAGLAQDTAAWWRVCIGSDLDGLIDPIDICPTASLYPNFRKRLAQFIPIFLNIRKLQTGNGQEIDLKDRGALSRAEAIALRNPQQRVKIYEDYFSPDFNLEKALDLLFYKSLRKFSADHLLKGYNAASDNANIVSNPNR